MAPQVGEGFILWGPGRLSAEAEEPSWGDRGEGPATSWDSSGVRPCEDGWLRCACGLWGPGHMTASPAPWSDSTAETGRGWQLRGTPGRRGPQPSLGIRLCLSGVGSWVGTGTAQGRYCSRSPGTPPHPKWLTLGPLIGERFGEGAQTPRRPDCPPGPPHSPRLPGPAGSEEPPHSEDRCSRWQ